MSKRRGFPIQAIGRAVMDCRPVKTLSAKARHYLAGIDAGRLRTICIVLVVGMLIGDIILLFRVGNPSRASPAYTVIHSVMTEGVKQRGSGEDKAFQRILDSLVADGEKKKELDSLLRVRPGLLDTIVRLEIKRN